MITRETANEWHARLSTREGILRELLARHTPGQLHDSPARAQLKREKLIESHRDINTKYHGSHWRLTAAGRAAAEAL